MNRLKRGYAVRSIDAIAHADQLPLRQADAPNATGPIEPDGHHRPPKPESGTFRGRRAANTGSIPAWSVQLG